MLSSAEFVMMLSKHCHRQLRTIQKSEGILIEEKGRSYLNFCTSDYLGLKDHPLLKQRAIAMIQQYGVGTGASRLVSGNCEYHERLEEKCAALLGYESALLFNTGYQTNITTLPALLDRHSIAIMDRHSHNSLIQGALLSRATVKRYAHQNLDQLETVLQKAKSYAQRIIVTETLFSMEGDLTDIDAIISLAKRYDALLYVDDAHAIGVMGERRMGMAAHKKGIDFVMGTFSKALGGCGAYLACRKEWRETLIQSCGGIIYSTALTPAMVGAADAALDLIPSLEGERQKLLHTARVLRHQLQSLGYDTGNSRSHIIPLIVGSDKKALSLQDILLNGGIYAIAIRPPSVEEGKARIRLTLTSQHTEDHLEQLKRALLHYHE